MRAKSEPASHRQAGRSSPAVAAAKLRSRRDRRRDFRCLHSPAHDESRSRQDDHDDRTEPHLSCPRFLSELRKARQQPGDVAATYRVLRHLLSVGWRQRRDQPARSAEFQRDEDRAKIGPDGGRCFELVSCSFHGRLQSGWFGEQLHSVSEPVAVHPPMGSCSCPASPACWDDWCRRSRRDREDQLQTRSPFG